MKYLTAVKQSMEKLAQDRNTVFIGYNILYGSKAYGTLSAVPAEMCIETPVAENLMAGLATGMALAGFKPVLFFERHDFILNALDCIVNHLDKLETLSHKEYSAPVIIRAIVGASEPLDPGPQHVQDFSLIFKALLTFPVIDLKTPREVIDGYNEAASLKSPVMLIERRDLYDSE